MPSVTRSSAYTRPFRPPRMMYLRPMVRDANRLSERRDAEPRGDRPDRGLEERGPGQEREPDRQREQRVPGPEEPVPDGDQAHFTAMMPQKLYHLKNTSTLR